MFSTYLRKLGLNDAQHEAVMSLYKVCFEQVASDVNKMTRQHSLSGAYQVGFDNDEWFPEQTVSDEVAERAKEAQIGYRKGVWNGAGRSLVCRNASSPENICADVGG